MAERNKNFFNLALAALFTALVFIATAYLPRVPIGSGGGYIHAGDAVIYLAASLLPRRLAMAAGALGGALADVLTGFPLWAPFTLLVKAALVPFFTHLPEKFLCGRNVAALFAAFPVTVGGYYAAEWILTGSRVVPLASVPYNAIQAAGSAAIYALLAFHMDKAGLKKRLRSR
ncbi:MAG: TIGR04002 family protein [Synergistaceae bacterium]|nr:TIGR04002 family protein [Synergistaceae bacterium]